jgi:MFS family permease
MASKAGDISLRTAWIVAAFFTAAYTFHSVDRFVISVVIEPLKLEFGFSDGQLGALAGLAHAIAYSIFVLPVGWMLDRTNRVRLFAAMLGIWSFLTLLGSFATNFWQLFAMRMGVGAAESATSPSVQSLVGSYFPTRLRASAMGVVFSGVAIGTGLVFAVGGFISDQFGWRYVFLVAGLPGMLLAFAMWFMIKEPPRRVSPDGVAVKPPSILQSILFVTKSPTILFSVMGLTLAALTVGSVWAWVVPIMVRESGFSLTEAGFVVGIAAGFMKFGSTFASGFLGDWIAKGRVDRLWIVPGIALILSLPAAIGISYATEKWGVVAFVMFLGFTLGSHYAAPRAVIVSVTPDHMRGSVTSVEQLLVNLFGAGMGPLITGLISDRLGGQISLALVATLALNVIAAICFWAASFGARDVEAAEGH